MNSEGQYVTIHISHQTRSIVIPFEPGLPNIFPHGVRFTWDSNDMFAIPHGIDETIALRNLEYPIPAPIVEHYAFPANDGKRPFAKQVLTAASMVMNPCSFVLNGMGTGKTRAAIWAFDYLRSEGLAKRMLVAAPLSTLEFTWAKEIFHTLPHLEVRVLSGSKERRLRLLAEEADIYIINHDGMKVLFPELRARRDIDVICFDEAAAFRNARADRSKAALKLALGRKYVWGMTGSPTPSAPTDAFGIARLVTPETAPRSWVGFRNETMVQVSNFRWVARKDAPDTIARTLQPAVRFSLDEIVELPPVVEREVEVPMGPRQRAAYDQLRDHASVLLKEGAITAANGAIVFTKMLQSALGWVYDNERKIIQLDNEARIQAILDIVEAAERKVIIFAPFKSATAGISAALKGAGVDYAEVTGDTPAGERNRIFNAFQGGENLRVLSAHPECMAHGLTLTAADTIIWASPITKLEIYEQANARITRVGQVHKQQVLKIVGSPVERLVYRRLKDKHELQESILDMLSELTGNGENS